MASSILFAWLNSLSDRMLISLAKGGDVMVLCKAALRPLSPLGDIIFPSLVFTSA